MRNTHILTLLFLMSSLLVNPDSLWSQGDSEGIAWMSWEEAVNRSQKEPRKFLVDIYTDWCGWCKRMDATTFTDPDLAEYINTTYYPIKFNAEQKKEISYHGKTYKFVDNGKHGYHALAAEITQGRLGYPTLVFLDQDMEVIQAINGYKKALEFEQIVTYFGNDFHRRMPWEKYIENYQPLGSLPAATRRQD